MALFGLGEHWSDDFWSWLKMCFDRAAKIRFWFLNCWNLSSRPHFISWQRILVASNFSWSNGLWSKNEIWSRWQIYGQTISHPIKIHCAIVCSVTAYQVFVCVFVVGILLFHSHFLIQSFFQLSNESYLFYHLFAW